jgi:glycosyltransferase involved in cell wall biosynthesis
MNSITARFSAVLPRRLEHWVRQESHEERPESGATDRREKSAFGEELLSEAPLPDVLVSSTLPAIGRGVSYSCASIARALSEQQYHVELIMPYGSEKSTGNYRVTHTRPTALGMIPFSKVRYFVQKRNAAVLRAVKRRNEEIFLHRAKDVAARRPTIAYIWPDCAASVLHQLRESGIPIVREMINCHVGTAKKLLDAEYARLGLPPAHGINAEMVDEETESLHLSDYIFCPSTLVERSVVDHGIPDSKLVPASFGWDPGRLRGEERALKPIEGATFLFVGLICVRKGAHLLMRYWAKSGIRGRLVMVGRMEPAIERICADYIRRDDVSIVDFTPNIHMYYRSADAFVFPSLEEGGPLVTHEAGGMGLPLLVSPMGAARLADDTTGVVLDPHDEDRWVETMRRLAKDQELRRELGSAAQRKAANFVWPEVSRTRSEAFRRIAQALGTSRAGEAVV